MLFLFLSALLLSTPAEASEPEPSGKMLKKVAKREDCNRDALQAAFLDEDTQQGIPYRSWEITGCGEPFVVTWASLMGQWIYTEDRAMRNKAPFDLDCPAAEVEFIFLDRNTRGAEGCGRRATYMQTMSGWAANVTSQ